MTKEQIIDTLWHLGFQFDGDKAVIDKHTMGIIADLLLAKFEQEKKEVAISIYKQLQGHGTTYVKNWIAKEYGVEV